MAQASKPRGVRHVEEADQDSPANNPGAVETEMGKMRPGSRAGGQSPLGLVSHGEFSPLLSENWRCECPRATSPKFRVYEM